MNDVSKKKQQVKTVRVNEKKAADHKLHKNEVQCREKVANDSIDMTCFDKNIDMEMLDS